MKAATITDGRIEVVERPDPEARRRHGGRAGARRRAQPGRPAPARRQLPRPAWFAARHPGPRVRGCRGSDAVRRRPASRSAPACSASPAVDRRPSTSPYRPRSARPFPTASTSIAMGGAPEAFVTAHDALITKAHLQPGEWLLVHAVGSGVGTTALQLAHRDRRARDRHGPHREQARPLPGARARARDRAAGHRRRARRRRARVVDPRSDRRRRARDHRPRGRPLRRGRHRGRRAPKAASSSSAWSPGTAAPFPSRAVMGKRLTIIGTVLRARSAAGEGGRDRRASSATSYRCSPTAASHRSSRRCCRSIRPPRPTSWSRPTRRSARSSSTAASDRRQ